jgi:hypothetical protein
MHSANFYFTLLFFNVPHLLFPMFHIYFLVFPMFHIYFSLLERHEDDHLETKAPLEKVSNKVYTKRKMEWKDFLSSMQICQS